jgi:hypothetical protein
MKLLNVLNKQTNLTEHAKMCIARYKIIYNRVIREAKRRENDKYILHVKNGSRAVWWIINKETGKASLNKQDIKIIRNSEEIKNPESLAELFKSYFCTISEELLKNNGNKMPNSKNYHIKIKERPKTVLFFPVTNSEVERVAKVLKNKFLAGIDEIPDCVVKHCIKLLKKPLANIYNASLESGIFPDQLKIAKVVPLHKKGGKRDIQNYRPIALLYVFFQSC